MSPALEEDWVIIKITECTTKIQHLEETIKEIKNERRNQRKEGVESQRYISNRRLAIYLCIASTFGGMVVTFLDKLLDILV